MNHRIIHQTWISTDVPRETYPEAWQRSWQEAHPAWEYRFWTDDDNEALVRDHYPQFLGGYRSINRGVVRSDVARVLYLHRFGGIYADMDFVCLRSLEPLLTQLQDHIVVGRHAQPLQPFPNAFLFSPPGHPFWLTLVEDALADWARGVRTVEHVAGPDRLKWCLDKYRPDHAELPSRVLYPFAWGDDRGTALARSLDWGNLDALRAAWPGSHAVTRWTHNW